MTAMDLLASNPDPTEAEIRHAIEGNYCRCTGYQNIVAAIQAAAATPQRIHCPPAACSAPALRSDHGHHLRLRASSAGRTPGSSPAPRPTPTTSSFPGLTYAAILRSPYAHARITGDRRERGRSARPASSRSTPAPTSRTGWSRFPAPGTCPTATSRCRPHPLLAYDKVRYVGDGVAMVVAETRARRPRRDRSHRRGLRAARGRRGSREDGRQPARPSFTTRCPATSRSPGWWPAATPSAAFRSAEVTVKQRIVQQRLLPTAMECPRRGGELQQGERPAHPLGHQPEPAHPPLPLLGDAQDPGASSSG